MNNTPSEVLHQVFIKVPFIDRLECMRVCRSWYAILDRQSLLYNLDISDAQFTRLDKILEHLHYRRVQVEYLTLRVHSPTYFDKRIICNMFPNLREVALFSRTSAVQKQNYMDNPFEYIHTSSKLESIKDYGECELTRQLIMSNACQHVRSLHLKGGQFWYSTDFVLPQLKNMPVLEHLYLSPFRIKLTDLETLHSNLPSIQSLELQANLVSGEFPCDIEPALLLTKLKLDLEYNEELDAHIQFYRYMSKKYPSLNTLVHDDDVIDEEDAENLQMLFERGILPFFQSIQPQIACLGLPSYYDGLNLFEKVDEFGWKLKEIEIMPPYDDHHFFEEIAHSEQSKHIQRLSLLHSVCEPIKMLSRMEALTSLKLEYFNAHVWTTNNINLSELIECAPPTLTTLTLAGIELQFNNITSKPSSITHLELKYMHLTPLLTELLTTHFPKLSIIKYHGALTSDHTITLPNHHLKEVNFTATYLKAAPYALSIEITCDDKVQYQVLKQDPHKDTPDGLVTVTKEEFDNLCTSNKLTFVCASVKKMIFSVSPY